MERILIALVVGLCLFAAGCPKRLVDKQHRQELTRLSQTGEMHNAQEEEGPAASSDELSAEGDSQLGGLEAGAEVVDGAGAPAGAEMDEDAARDGSASSGTGGFVGPVAGAPGDASADEPGDEPGDGDPGDAGNNGEAAPSNNDQPPADEAAGPGAGDSSGGQNLLDPGSNDGGDVINGPPGYGSQQAAGAAGLAGTWQVVSATAEDASVSFKPGDWELELGADGAMAITRTDGGSKRRQSGSWQADKGSVSFNLGPGGQPSYTVLGDDPDVKVFIGETSQTALFAVRLAPGAAVPQLYQRYDSDFGALKFSQSGPGMWNGSYGDSGGKLAVRMTGPFCAGTWEQGSARGGVILRLTASGFTGWWWYDGSLKIDGTWNGATGK